MSTYNRSAMIFDCEDSDGDAMSVYTLASARYAPAVLAVVVNAETDGEQIAHLTPEDVTALREALKPHDPAEKDAEPMAPPLKVGDRVVVTAPVRATRAVILAAMDSEGEYLVRFEDGRYPGMQGYLTAEEVAPAEPEPAPALPLDPARIAAVTVAFQILGEDGASVDTDSLLAIADFLVDAR